jgi:hypothetical protein
VSAAAPRSTTPAARLRALHANPSAPGAGLAAACLALIALIMYLGRGIGFYFDEWNFLLERRGISADTFLKPHNEHISVVPVAIYKVLLQIFGLSHHWPFLLVLALMQAALGVGLFLLVRPRLGGWAALGVAVLVMFMGLAWQNIVWSFQIGFVGSVLGGVWALVALDRRDARGDVLACVALVLATLSSSLGVPLAIGVAVELLVGGRRRALWVAAIPIVIYVAWYLGYGVGDITAEGVFHAAGWAVSAVAASAGALFGLGSDWGEVLALAFLALLVWRTAVAPWSPRLAGLVVAGVTFWALTGAARSVFQPPVPPDTSRYQTLGGVVLALATVELLAGLVVVPPRMTLVGAAIVALAVALGLPALRDNARQIRTISGTTNAELGALTLVGRSAPPGYQPDSNLAPQLFAGTYLDLSRSLGSSAGDKPSKLAGALSGDRAAADRVLQEVAGRLTPAAGAPQACTVQKQAVVTAPVPRGGMVIRTAGKQGVEVKLRRFGSAFALPPLGTVAPGKPQLLKLPPDNAPQPYEVQLASPTGSATCVP